MSGIKKRLARIRAAASSDWKQARALLTELVDRGGEPDFTCNVCRRQIRHALDSECHLTLPEEAGRIIGGQRRERERCPICDSSDWSRFTVEVLRKHTDIYTADCVALLIAPSHGLERALRRNRNIAITTGDLARGRAELQLDVAHLALRNHIYDFVICCHVLEHVKDERGAVEELKRVLNPGGQILLSMPICIDNARTLDTDKSSLPESEQQALYGRPDHVRLYGLDTADRLRGYGLIVNEIVADESWAPEIAKYKLLYGDRNFLCTVPE